MCGCTRCSSWFIVAAFNFEKSNFTKLLSNSKAIMLKQWLSMLVTDVLNIIFFPCFNGEQKNTAPAQHKLTMHNFLNMYAQCNGIKYSVQYGIVFYEFNGGNSFEKQHTHTLSLSLCRKSPPPPPHPFSLSFASTFRS